MSAWKIAEHWKAKHKELCEATPPLSRTMHQQLEIDNAWLSYQAAKDWAGYEDSEVKARAECLAILRRNS